MQKFLKLGLAAVDHDPIPAILSSALFVSRRRLLRDPRLIRANYGVSPLRVRNQLVKLAPITGGYSWFR